jgi:AcrR family transcriptional regulator
MHSGCQGAQEVEFGMTPQPSSPEEDRSEEARPLRADARRNRRRLLEAAEDVFTAEGASASTEEVARQAGVGIGTLFRHFPTKEALVQAVVAVRVGRLVEEAEALAADGVRCTGFFEVLAGGFVDAEGVAPGLRRRLRRKIGDLLGRAQEAGTVRDDVGVHEVMALLVGAVRAAEHAGEDRELRERIAAVLLDGLRPARGR